MFIDVFGRMMRLVACKFKVTLIYMFENFLNCSLHLNMLNISFKSNDNSSDNDDFQIQ